jgi:hypothetical protein
VCHQFRYDWDLFPTWSKPSPHPGGVREVLEYTATSPFPAALRPLSAPGAVMDLDFLVVGCPTDANCEPFSPAPLVPLTDEEQQTQMSMWCILGAPLIIGSDVRRLSPRALATLGNADAIAIDQDALRAPARLLDAAALALLNVGEAAAEFVVPLAGAGLSGGAWAFDVWKKSNVSVAGAVRATVAPHETLLLRLTPHGLCGMLPLQRRLQSRGRA